jgi:potassium efflux system protein
MKWLIGLVLAVQMAAGAGIDVKLYEGADKEAYYQEIRKQIDAAAQSGKYPEAIIQEELLQLKRVRSAASQVVQTEQYDLKALSESQIDLKSYYDVLGIAATLRLKRKQHSQVKRDVQSKLTFLKQTIDAVTEKEKPRLLSYQLQFAYYKLQQKNIEAKDARLQTLEEKVMKGLFRGLASLQCTASKTIGSKLARIDSETEKILREKIALKIDLERALIEESGKREQLTKKIEQADTGYQKLLGEKIMLKTQQSLCMLREKRNKAFFSQLDEIETVTSQISGDRRAFFAEQADTLREIAKKVFGSTQLFLGATRQESLAAWADLKAFVSSPLFVFNERPISLLGLIKAVALIVFGIFLGVLYKRWIARIARKWPDMSQMSIRLASNIGYYLIVIIAVMVGISSIGIDMTSISLIAGALSIGIGFGLQTVVSNLVAGVILMFERTIRIGDVIEISDVLRGKVTDMRIRSTTIKTYDNIDIVIPNSSFIQNNVINWTLEDVTRRFHIPFSVAYGTSVDDVKKAVLEELAQSDLFYIRSDGDKQPDVWMVAMNSSSVDFELLVWVEWGHKLRPNSLKSDFLILIYNALYKNGIQIPFPQLDLHVKEMPPEPPE